MPLFALPETVRDYRIVSTSDHQYLRSSGTPIWPAGKRFAFSIFDDPDAQSLQQSKIVYSFLSELGPMTTRGIWMLEPRVRGRLQPRFVQQMERLAGKNGWFVPVGTLLNFLRNKRGIHPLSNRERAFMERRWLISKLRHGTS